MPSHEPTAALPPDMNIFVGRQPIFDRREKVFGYELLFRANQRDNFSGACDGEDATRHTISRSVNVLGLDHLTGGRKAFVNVTRDILLDELYTLLPSELTVIELLETIEPDQPVIEACRRLKQARYALALDDFVFEPKFEPLLELADFVKIDFLAMSRRARREVARELARPRLSLIAEKLESRDDFREALDLGYGYFQGYFFCKPQIMSGRDLPGHKQTYLRFLQQVNQPSLDYAKLEQILKEDASLMVKLLRYLNSASVGLRHKVQSVRQALTLMGEHPLKKWASLVAMTNLAEDKPSELLTLCLVRARFCEQVGRITGLAGCELDLFLMGLLSAIDALVDRPLREVLNEMPVSPDVKAALLGSGTTLGTIYCLALACERGNAELASVLASRLNVPENGADEAYWESIIWADDILRSGDRHSAAA